MGQKIAMFTVTRATLFCTCPKVSDSKIESSKLSGAQILTKNEKGMIRNKITKEFFFYLPTLF